MKTLLVLRHAKSDRAGFSGPDKSRPLAERGEKEAPAMGKALKKLGLIPDLVLCSTATRARQTADLATKKLKTEVQRLDLESLYLATGDALVDLVAQHGSGNTVLLIGHNPGLEEMVSRLLGGLARVPLRTAAIARIDLDIPDWSALRRSNGSLAFLLTPEVVQEL